MLGRQAPSKPNISFEVGKLELGFSENKNIFNGATSHPGCTTIEV